MISAAFQTEVIVALLAPIEHALATYSPLGRPAHVVISVGEFSDWCTDALVAIVEGSELSRAETSTRPVTFGSGGERGCADLVDTLTVSLELRRPGWPVIDRNGNTDRKAIMEAAGNLLADGQILQSALVAAVSALPDVLERSGLDEQHPYLDLPITVGLRRALVLDGSDGRGWQIDVTIEVPLLCVDLGWLPLEEILAVTECPPDVDAPLEQPGSSDPADWVN